MGHIEEIDHTGQIRRIDLRLREKYPFLKTRIFKLTQFDFVIYVENLIGSFTKLVEEFEHSIRFVTAPVKIVSSIPETYINEIPPINDSDIPSDFEGIPLTVFELANLIQSIHPEISVSDIREDFSAHQGTILLQGNVDENTKKKVLTTALKFKIPMKIDIKDGAPHTIIKAPENAVFSIVSSKGMERLDLPFLRRDEEMWFDNINTIYNGTFTKKDLFFLDLREKSCFIDFSVFRNINLRNHLLLYDTVFCSLPLLGHSDEFLEDQKITRQELLYLASKNRIKVIITQPEFRHDYTIFREIYDTNPNSIISRRAIVALCAIDIVETNRNYIFNDDDLSQMVVPLAEGMADATGIDPKIIANSILWPKTALRASFDSLISASTKRITDFGVNRVILGSMPPDVKKRYEFEFTVSSEAIHIAHALDATYFPFAKDVSGYSDQPYVAMMGNALNLYKCLNKETLNEYLSVEKMKYSGTNILDPISIIETNEYLSIVDFEAEVANRFIRSGFRSIFDELSSLSDSDRRKRIEEYNKCVEDYTRNANRKKAGYDFATDTVGLIIPFLGTAKNLASFLYTKVKNRSQAIRKFAEKIEEKANYNITGDKKISLLTKLSRVARLKRDYTAKN